MLKMIFQKEFALLLRNKFLAIPLIINVLFWGYMVVSYEIQDIHIQERATAFYSGFLWIMLFNLLIIGLFAVYMTSKDRESEFEDLVVTYRVKNTEWITGKWLATQVYGLCITLVTLLIQAGWFLSGKMAIGDVVKNVFYLFIQMEGAFFLVISLGFLCGVLMKHIFAYILVPAILTLSLLMPIDFTDTGDALWFDNPRLHLLTPFDLMYVGSPYEGIWGLHRAFGSAVAHQSAVFLLGIAVLLIALVFFHTNRRIQREKKIVPILIIIVMIPTLLLGGIRYVQYDQGLKQFVATAEPYVKGYEDSNWSGEYYEWLNSYYETYRDHTKYDFSMERAELDVGLQSNHQIAVASKLTIKHNGDEPTKEVKLTLYHGLKVTECTSESGVTCTRDNDLVTLHFKKMIEPGDEFDLNLKYEGNILQYSYEGYMEKSFIHNNRVYLPKEAGWYPLIGERQLIVARESDQHYLKFEQRNGRLVEDFPTAFTVKITNENSKVPLALTIPETGTGTYEGTSQYGLSLVGGNIKETIIDQIRVVGHPDILNTAKETIGKYKETWAFVEDWLDVPMTPKVIYILNDRHVDETLNTPSQEVLMWNKYDFMYANSDDDIAAYSAVMHLFNRMPFVERSTDLELLEELIRWTILSTFQDEGDFKKWYRPMVTPVEEREKLLIEALDKYEEQYEFSDVIKFLYHQYAELDNQQDFNMKEALQLYEGEKSL